MPPNGPRERRAAARLKVMQLMLLLPPPLPLLPLSSRGCQKQGYAKSGEQMGSPSYVLADGGREREREGEGSTPSSLGGQSVQRRLACRNSPFPPSGFQQEIYFCSLSESRLGSSPHSATHAAPRLQFLYAHSQRKCSFRQSCG